MHNTPYTGSYTGRDIFNTQTIASQLAGKLLYDAPARGWQHYEGLDYTLTTAIRIARNYAAESGPYMLQQLYNNPDIIEQLEALQHSLQQLALHGQEALSTSNRLSLSAGGHIIECLIRHTLIVTEANRSGTFEQTLHELLETHDNAYWNQRVEKLMRSKASRRDSENDYYHHWQFSHYLADVCRVLCVICHELDIGQGTQPAH